jgi:hypothetical protein
MTRRNRPTIFSSNLQINSRKRAQSIYGLQSAQKSRFRVPHFDLSAIKKCPTPPPFSFYASENINVTLILARNACENKQLTDYLNRDALLPTSKFASR